MIYADNLNFIFLEYAAAVDYHVCSAKGCVMSFAEDKTLASVFCDSSFKLHYSPLPLLFHTTFRIRASNASCMPRRCFSLLSL